MASTSLMAGMAPVDQRSVAASRGTLQQPEPAADHQRYQPSTVDRTRRSPTAVPHAGGSPSALSSSTRRYLFGLQGSRPCWRAVLRAAGVGQGGAPAAKRGRTTLTNPRAGACWLWAEARWCGGALRYLGARRTRRRRLHLRLGVPHEGRSAVASMFQGRPARVLAGTPVAGADRETTRDVKVGGACHQPRR